MPPEQAKMEIVVDTSKLDAAIEQAERKVQRLEERIAASRAFRMVTQQAEIRAAGVMFDYRWTADCGRWLDRDDPVVWTTIDAGLSRLAWVCAAVWSLAVAAWLVAGWTG